jgi:hypothetical protein
VRSLVLWGAGRPGVARARQGKGAKVLAWGEAAGSALRAAGIASETAEARLGPEHPQWREAAVLAWTAAFSQLPLIDGRSFAEEATWKSESLGWCVEAFFRGPARSPRYVALLETFRMLLEAEAPDEVEAFGLPPEEALLLGRSCTALRILFHGRGAAARAPAPSLRLRRAGEAVASLWAAVRPRRAPSAATPGTAAPVLWLVQGEPSLPPPDPPAGAVPPLRPDVRRYSRWRVFSEVRRARASFRRQWKRLSGSPGLQDLFRHRGVTFADLGRRDLAELMLIELPRAVLRIEQVAATLRALAPSLVLLAAEDRAAQAGCRAGGVPFVFPRGFKESAASSPDRGPAPGVVG